MDVPGEMAVTGVDKDKIFCEFSDPPLPSLSLNTQQIDFEAAALSARLMADDFGIQRSFRS